MSYMNREDAMKLVKFFDGNATQTSSRTALAVAYNCCESFIVREVKESLESAMRNWVVPGLFVAYYDLELQHRPYVVVLYKFGCGTVLFIKLEKKNARTPPQHLGVLELGVFFDGDLGYKIPFEHWYQPSKEVEPIS